MGFFRLRLVPLSFPAALLAAGVVGLIVPPLALAAETIRMGYTLQFENPNHLKEAVLAFRYLFKDALSDESIDVQLREFPDFEAGLEAVRRRQIDGTIVPGHALAGMTSGEFVPELVVQRQRDITEQFVLLSRHGTDLERLRGGSLRIVNRRNRGIPSYWLAAELRAACRTSPDQFFSGVTHCGLSPDAILPTFFGKADACLIAEADFQLLNELNPQLGQQLSVVLTSPPVMPLLIVRHRDYHSELLPALIDRAVHLHEKPKGQQVFKLLQLSRFNRFGEEDFAGTRKLVAFAENLQIRQLNFLMKLLIPLPILLVLLLAQAPAEPAREIRAGFTINPTRNLGEYSEKDLFIATQVLLRNAFPDLLLKCTSFPEAQLVIAAALAGELDLIEVPPVAYFSEYPELQKSFEPLCVTATSKSRLDRFFLLAAPGTELPQLGGKRLYLHLGHDRGVIDLWLRGLLKEPVAQYFASIQESQRAEKVILETFFGRADACVVREEDYQVMGELNPQITQRLVPVAISPEVPIVLVAHRSGLDPELRKTLRAQIPTYGGHPKVMQALTMLKITRLVMAKESDFAGIATLLAQAPQAVAQIPALP